MLVWCLEFRGHKFTEGKGQIGRLAVRCYSTALKLSKMFSFTLAHNSFRTLGACPSLSFSTNFNPSLIAQPAPSTDSSGTLSLLPSTAPRASSSRQSLHARLLYRPLPHPALPVRISSSELLPHLPSNLSYRRQSFNTVAFVARRCLNGISPSGSSGIHSSSNESLAEVPRIRVALSLIENACSCRVCNAMVIRKMGAEAMLCWTVRFSKFEGRCWEEARCYVASCLRVEVQVMASGNNWLLPPLILVQ